ncbi:MAG TPA: DMT family transporter, partial [Actinomycetes bacterium]|nr:DMT family transporter [Actinomycetes bacterium]
VDVSLSPRALFGDMLALAGGVFSGAYVVVGAQVRRHASTSAYTAVCYGVCAGLLLVVCLATGQALTGYAAIDWARLVALAVAAQLLGHSVFNYVLRRVSPTVVSLTILLEVPGAALIAALFLGQIPPLAAIPAVGLILAGIGIVIGARPGPQPTAMPGE